LAAELDQHIGSGDESNRKDGSTPKTVKSTSGSFQLDTPRDRNGSFEPQLVKKHQTHLTDEIERKLSINNQNLPFINIQKLSVIIIKKLFSILIIEFDGKCSVSFFVFSWKFLHVD
jgi:hypothetical protein